jgi:hypothetical protein
MNGAGADSAEPAKRDPTAVVVVEEKVKSKAITPTGLETDGHVDGIIDLQIPNLLPTDNVEVERVVKVMRTKIPIRITRIGIQVIDNGFIVELPQAGRQSDFGPDGSNHAFTDKGEMLKFIGQVVGQVTYQYNETEMRDVHRATARGQVTTEDVEIPSIEEKIAEAFDVQLEGFEPTMRVQ